VQERALAGDQDPAVVAMGGERREQGTCVQGGYGGVFGCGPVWWEKEVGPA
jgi:hypothetical protein